MADPILPACLSSLPVEIQTSIFAFVRERTTQAAICLTNRQCRDVMAPIFFENFKLQKRKITMQTIGTLLNPKNGITPHVRNLFIVNGCWEKEECWKHGVIIDPMLQLVVSAFPQDRLRALVGDDEIVLDTTLLVSLLQHQSRLKRLAVYHRMRPDGPVIDLEDKNLVSWAASRCADVESLTVLLRTDYVDTYTPAGFLVRSAPNIKDLRIKEHGNQKHPALPLLRPLGTWGKVGYNAFGGLAAEDEDGRAILELSHMSLEHVALDSRSLGSIRKHVKLSKLESLELLRCPEAHLLLTVLPSGCNLTKLIFEQANAHIRTDQDQQAIERLLNSFSGLRVLSLSLYDRMVDVSCIIHHGSSLRQLGIHCYSTCLSVDDLEELLQSSPHLEGLGVDFCKVRLGEVEHAISNFKLAQMHGEAHAASELETYLVSNSLHHSCISADTNSDASDCHLSPRHTEMHTHLYPSGYRTLRRVAPRARCRTPTGRRVRRGNADYHAALRYRDTVLYERLGLESKILGYDAECRGSE